MSVGLVLGGCAALAVVGALLQPAPVGRDAGRSPSPTQPTPRGERILLPYGLTLREVAPVIMIAALSGLVLPPLGLAVLVLPAIRRWAAQRRKRRRAARRLASALPDAVDLFLLCGGAGISLPLALPLVAARAPEPVRAALESAERAVAAGSARSDALVDHLAGLGDQAAGLAHILVDHLRYGVPLEAGLERIAFELRLARRRLAEEEARRLPVRLLAPLLLCVLPAFVLLTVAPLLVAALRSLPR